MSKAAQREAENCRLFADKVTAARDSQHLQSPTQMNVTTREPTIHPQRKLYNGVKPLRIDHFNMFSAEVYASVVFYSEMGSGH